MQTYDPQQPRAPMHLCEVQSKQGQEQNMHNAAEAGQQGSRQQTRTQQNANPEGMMIEQVSQGGVTNQEAQIRGRLAANEDLMQIQGAQILNQQGQNQEAMDLSLRLQGPSAQATMQRNEEVNIAVSSSMGMQELRMRQTTLTIGIQHPMATPPVLPNLQLQLQTYQAIQQQVQVPMMAGESFPHQQYSSEVRDTALLQMGSAFNPISRPQLHIPQQPFQTPTHQNPHLGTTATAPRAPPMVLHGAADDLPASKPS
jgi:hypothetical protein